MDDKISEKYTKMFKDEGTKEVYEADQAAAYIQFSIAETINALESVSLDKANSWDYIPGLVYKRIINTKETYEERFLQICSSMA
jgi:hypothetical protein